MNSLEGFYFRDTLNMVVRMVLGLKSALREGDGQKLAARLEVLEEEIAARLAMFKPKEEGTPMQTESEEG